MGYSIKIKTIIRLDKSLSNQLQGHTIEDQFVHLLYMM